MTPQNKLEPSSPKVIKPIPIIETYPKPLFPKPSNSPFTLILKLSNPSHLNKININMNMSIQI